MNDADDLDYVPRPVEPEDLFDFAFLDTMAALGWVPTDLPGSDQIGWRRRAVIAPPTEPDDFYPETEQPPDEDA